MTTYSAVSRSARALALACVTSLILGHAPFTAGTARGEDVAFDEGGTVVSNDGETYPPAPAVFDSSPPFAGTGVLPEGARAAFAAPRDDLRPMEAFATESVIGVDERKQITDTTVFPFRAIVSLQMTFPSSSTFICTGFMIDADTIATAGHCVYSADQGGWATSITAYPGRNGATAPYGAASATHLYSVTGWVDDTDHRYDYGAIKIDSNLGNTTGWLGYGVKNNDAALAGVRAKIYGYPGDKPAGTMWGMPRRIKGVDANKLFYKTDTFGGQSGSPVYGKLSNACTPCAFGIHAYGVGIEPYPESNSGTRVNSTVFANLAFWATQ